MAKKKKDIPNYGKVIHNGIEYYRTRVTDADGKRVAIYGETPEEFYQKLQEAKRQIEDAIYRRENPTVADYCEKWLKIRSATIRPAHSRIMKRLWANILSNRLAICTWMR